jgi:hypothetical protein
MRLSSRAVNAAATVVEAGTVTNADCSLKGKEPAGVLVSARVNAAVADAGDDMDPFSEDGAGSLRGFPPWVQVRG